MYGPAESLIFEFGDFRVDIRKRQIYRNQDAVQVTAKAFDTLAVLLAANGETVSKAELMDIVWTETAVEENNLTQQISALRKAFGERAADHKFIVTVPGRGYRFVATVRRAEAVAEKPVEAPVIRLDNQRGTWRNSLFGYGVAAMYILAVCVPAFVVSLSAESRGLKPQSIAIMRFRSAGVGDELLGMGIRDTLRAKLGNLGDVTVRPWEPNVGDNVVDAGRQLNVDVVVTGSIQHDEDRIRVAVEMVDVTNEKIVWGNTFDDVVSNEFELQDSITNAVVSVLKKPKLSGALNRPTEKADFASATFSNRSRPSVHRNERAVELV